MPASPSKARAAPSRVLGALCGGAVLALLAGWAGAANLSGVG
ncbi:MAG: hypothetical protein FD126_2624, partial [Elusimicrobia bacterium]